MNGNASQTVVIKNQNLSGKIELLAVRPKYDNNWDFCFNFLKDFLFHSILNGDSWFQCNPEVYTLEI
jgi:hypothetical protein